LIVTFVALALQATAAPAAVAQYSGSQLRFREAMALIHDYSGAGDELSRAMSAAESLYESDPRSGFSQTIEAEALSTWSLDQNGEPAEVRARIIMLADEALRMNPQVPQAYVAKSRAYSRASMLSEARAEVDKALAIDPSLETAIFQQAEIYRRTGDLANAELRYRDFIATTASPLRKSNGYYWMGKMYNDVAYATQGQKRNEYLMIARSSYQSMVDLDPRGAWKLVNFAIFLNGVVADFDAAEEYAQRALSVMEFPMARYHLAAARYQKLLLRAAAMNRDALRESIAQVAASTRVSLSQAIAFRSLSAVVVSRLSDLQARSVE
jgi:tetratricopeptide (TPR) repeat protein